VAKRDRDHAVEARQAGEQPLGPDGVGWAYYTTKGNFFSLLDPSIAFSRELPGEAIVGELLVLAEPGGAAMRPGQIRVNPVFVDFLHRVIATYAPSLEEFQGEVQRQRDVWIYVVDARTPTPQGEVPPEDIIGAFEVRGRQLVSDSYRAFPAHQIVPERGLFRLTDVLQDCLLWELEQLTAH
jgi:hypothetical protein